MCLSGNLVALVQRYGLLAEWANPVSQKKLKTGWTLPVLASCPDCGVYVERKV